MQQSRAFRVKNAVMQGKNECVHHHDDEAIELFYNQQRIQKGLDFQTPNQMAEDFYKLAA